MRTLFVFAAIIFMYQPARLQTSQAEREQIRRGKIESIVRLQDIRAPFDAALLSDDDPVIRRRAALACGSLQDTSAVGLLARRLSDPDSATALAAAFAIGQTGSRLSERGRQSLEHDLIWNRLKDTKAAGRLIEEIGKFGTQSALRDLLTVAGNTAAGGHLTDLMMSVARFAIRGISSPEAVKFLLRRLRGGTRAPWQAVYALQRTGDNRETRGSIAVIRKLESSTDPLVRMNLATLIGKVRDAGGPADCLMRMAGLDPDWRVRVNALKALGQFSWKGNAGVIATFRRAFSDSNPHIAITALSVFPAIGADANDTSGEALRALRELASIAENRSADIPWQVQAESAGALAKIDRKVPRALLSGSQIANGKLRARLLVSAGESGDQAAAGLLSAAVAPGDPQIVSAALAGFQALAHRTPEDRQLADSVYRAAIRSLGIHDMAVVSTAAGVLEDSLFRRREAVRPLLEALKDLHPPGDTETMQDLIGALGEIRDSSASGALIELLRSGEPALAGAAVTSLRKITGRDYSSRVVGGSGNVRPEADFEFLRSLPPVVSVKLETSKGNILIDLDAVGAPFTTMSMVKLSEERAFYRGLTFHRVVPNFVVQGGDPRGDGWGGPGYSIRSEFSMEQFGTGTVGIASAGKDTEGSQFFITHSPQPHLDGRYTVVGKVTSGMDVVDRLQVGDRINEMKILR